jgi:RNA polymerase sigma-70 factor, ECF subfamily
VLEKSRIEAIWASRLSEQVRQNGKLFFRLAYEILHDAAGAEDVCQQAFSKAWERRAEIEDESLRGWLAKVVVNESLAIVRRRKAEKRAMLSRAEVNPAASMDGAPATELRESVLIALEHLPEKARLVVVLRLMNGMSGNEVKSLLDCSAAEVSRQLYLAMEMLRKHLSDWTFTPMR